MNIDVYDMTGKVVGQTELNESVWGIEPHIAVMHQALLRQQANARLGTHDTKTRSEVRGGGRKPWRQKGTGRARQGSTRSPQWTGGGVVFGPHPRSYEQAMPRKMRRLAIRSVLSAKVRDERLTVVRGLAEVQGRTKAMREALAVLPTGRSTLIIVPDKESAETVYRAAGNLPGVELLIAPMVNVRDALKFERMIVMEEAIPVIEELWGLPEDQREPGTFRALRLKRLANRQRSTFAAVAQRDSDAATAASAQEGQ